MLDVLTFNLSVFYFYHSLSVQLLFSLRNTESDIISVFLKFLI